MFLRYSIYVFVLIFLCHPTTLARWGRLEDASVAIEFLNRTIDVDECGKVEETQELLIKILNENGRISYGTYSLLYNKTNEKIENLEAKTVFNLNDQQIDQLFQGDSIKNLKISAQDLDQTMIENRAIASQNLSFDDNHLITLSYPNAKVNAWLYLKFKRTTFQPPVPNYYSFFQKYGGQRIRNKSKITLRSKLPFKIKVHDLENNLTVQESHNQGIQQLTVTQNKPIVRFLVNEPGYFIYDEQKSTFVQVSTHSDYKTIGNILAPQYEDVLSAALPSQLETIVKKAREKADEIDQINTVTSGLMDSIRYMTDMRTIKGRIIPQSFKDVAHTEVGDCKDFSSLTTKILRLLGYEAYVCLIHRDGIYQDSSLKLPMIETFNHAIVKVIAPSGQIYWIDPTNMASMAGIIFEDISNRQVLVLKSQDARLETTPSVNPQVSQALREEIIAFDTKQNMIHKNGKLMLKGQQAYDYAVLNFNNSREYVEDILIRDLTSDNDVKTYRFKRDLTKSRTVKPVEIEFECIQNNDNPFSNGGSSFSLSSPWLNAYLATSIHQEGISFLGFPMTLTKSYLLKDCSASTIEVLDCHLKCPWFEADRTCEIDASDIRITEKVIFLKSFITPEEIRSPEFVKIKQDLKKYFGNPLLIFFHNKNVSK